MSDALATIRDRLAKAQSKAARAEKAWEVAKAEVSDLETTLRVMSDIVGGGSSTNASPTTQDRQVIISRLLDIGEQRGKSPSDIFEEFKAIGSEALTSDTFRTTIWRMKDQPISDGQDMWLIKGENGRYWKVPATLGTQVRYAPEPQRQRWASTQEDDSDIPF